MVKTHFGIKDLENLSKVKAHTIRIWEKRYNLLEPDRTDTNIRKYDLENLKKLLNIAFLYKAGYKISTLANFEQSHIRELINENLKNLDADYILQVFKSSMLEFDGALFNATLKNLLEQKSFRKVFSEIFIPLLNEVGVLWHSGTVDPSHEHFISEKIKHAIILQSEKVSQQKRKKEKPIFVLYLPSGEIHEIGLLYANYELLSAGYNTIFLGANIPLQSLNHVLKQQENIIFLTYFTVRPEEDNIQLYVEEFQNEVCASAPCELWVLGSKASDSKIPENVRFFNDLKLFIAALGEKTNS